MLIFVYGDDGFNAKEKVRVMREAFMDKFDASGTNVVEFPFKDQKKFDIGQVAQAVGSPPFLASKRMVVLKGLMSEVTRKPESKPWIELFESIPESTIVVLHEKLSVAKIGRHAIVQNFKSQEGVHEYIFEPMSEVAAVKWTEMEVKSRDLDMSTELCRKFISMAGVDTWILSLELDKLASYCKGRKATQQDLDILVRPSADDQMFAFLDALSQRNAVRVKQLLEQQRLFGTPDMQLFGMLVRQLRLLVAASDFFEQNPGSGQKDLAQALSVHPFVAKKLADQQSRFLKEELIAVQAQMLESDLYVKTGVLASNQAVDFSIVLLTGFNN